MRTIWLSSSLGIILAISALADAEPIQNYPCVSCEAYDYGWLHAASAGYRDPEDCDFDSDDEWAEDFIEGCLDYVNSRKAKELIKGIGLQPEPPPMRLK